MDCSKTFTINVEDNGPCAVMFDNLVWPPPTILTFGIGAASGTFEGRVTHCECSATATDTEGGSGLIECRGGFDYTGPEITCCADIDFIINDVGPGASSGLQIQVFQDGIGVALFTQDTIPPYQFTIAEALVPSLIECYVSASSGAEAGLGGNSASITMDCTFGECP